MREGRRAWALDLRRVWICVHHRLFFDPREELLEKKRQKGVQVVLRRPISERARTLSDATKRVAKLLGQNVFPGERRGSHCRALRPLGAPDMTGLCRRPLLAGGVKTESVLRAFAQEMQTPQQNMLLL